MTDGILDEVFRVNYYASMAMELLSKLVREMRAGKGRAYHFYFVPIRDRL